jgi:hypothetical protein
MYYQNSSEINVNNFGYLVIIFAQRKLDILLFAFWRERVNNKPRMKDSDGD